MLYASTAAYSRLYSSSVKQDEVYARLRAQLRVIPYAHVYVAHDVMTGAAALSFIASVFKTHKNNAT